MPSNSSEVTWVLLRGLAREKGHWGDFLEQFEEQFAPHAVLALDLPGAGEFRDSPSPRSISEIFQFVRAKAIERAPVESKFQLVALSLGGMVAMEWMRQRPEDLSGCVLINTSLRAVSPIYHRLRWQIWRKFVAIAAMQAPREREKALVELLMNRPEARQRALALWTRLAVERPMTYLSFGNQILAAMTFHGLKQAPDVPVLLLNSLGDRLVDPSCSERMHERWGWPIERHAWAGHDLPWDDPQWVLAKLKEWSSFIDTRQ